MALGFYEYFCMGGHHYPNFCLSQWPPIYWSRVNNERSKDERVSQRLSDRNPINYAASFHRSDFRPGGLNQYFASSEKSNCPSLTNITLLLETSVLSAAPSISSSSHLPLFNVSHFLLLSPNSVPAHMLVIMEGLKYFVVSAAERNGQVTNI